MYKLIIDFLSYLKAIFVESGRWVLTIFDIIGIVLFFQPHLLESLLENTQFVRSVGGGIFLLSFIIANFMVYKKLIPPVLDEQSLRLYQHSTKTSDAVLMKYQSSERADDLVVLLSYKAKNGQTKEKRVDQFYPPNDPHLLFHGGPIESLEPGQETYFFLLIGEDNSEQKVTVHVSFVGAKSGRQVKFNRQFPITKPVDPSILIDFA